MVPDVLPIDAAIDDIRQALIRSRAVVVVAAPGAGKTTRLPAALVGDGPVILLQPRRVAARSVAQRIADEQGWTIGREIGWHVRFDRRFTAETRLLVATEGILTARLQQDPLASSFRTIVLDEFHERSIHGDLGLALATEAWRARSDLRLVVMSATLDAAPVAEFLGRCPVIEVAGTRHPLEVAYEPGRSVEDATLALLPEAAGSVLCFLPGAGEIQRAIAALWPRIGNDFDVIPLHGGLTAAEQDRALAPVTTRRRVVVATNLAETSVTVPGVTLVVDSGLQKVARYDAARAIDSLVVERVSLDAADQRAGRSARQGPGRACRLWDPRDRLRAHREAEIHRTDLSGVALDVIAWGGDPRAFSWFEAPRHEAIEAALSLLERLGAIRGCLLTDIGRRMQRLPLHPRLARILVAAGGARTAARACALLSERLFLPPRSAATTSDLLSALDGWMHLPPHVHRAAAQIEGLVDSAADVQARDLGDRDFRQALLAGYPDRVAQRREPRSARVKLASGAGAAIAAESGVLEGEWLIALDVHTSTHPGQSESRIRMASRIEREWLARTRTDRRVWVDDDGRVRVAETDRYDELVLAERPIKPEPAEAADLLAGAWLARPPSDEDTRFLRRLRFAGLAVDVPGLVHRAVVGVLSLADVALDRALPAASLSTLARHAPDTLAVPSGRAVRLEYHEDGTVSASIKLQELFGLGETPRIGPGRQPVLMSLLAPNGRPVQTTRDLRSFWERTYPEVRRELRGRYPRHPWPEDPWNAPPTARTTRRSR